MSINSRTGESSNDVLLERYHETRNNPKKVVCIEDNPPMVGFGKTLKVGDVIVIKGTIHNELGFCVSVPSECAFYEYSYFKPHDDFYNE